VKLSKSFSRTTYSVHPMQGNSLPGGQLVVGCYHGFSGIPETPGENDQNTFGPEVPLDTVELIGYARCVYESSA
jgi:hypothetical protein